MKIFLLILTAVLSQCNETKRNLDINPSVTADKALDLNMERKTLLTGWYQVSTDSNGFYRQQIKKSEVGYYIDPKPIVNLTDFYSVNLISTNFNNPEDNDTSVSLQLEPESHEHWTESTRRNRRKVIVFIFKNNLITAPTVQWEISDGSSVINRNDISEKYSEELMEKIKSLKLDDDLNEI
jgi:preprotein translocase subunit SecD